MKIAISPSSFGSSPEVLKLLNETGVEIIDNPYKRRLTEDEIKTHLVGVDGLIAGLEPLNRSVLVSAAELKAIARVGIGMSNVDLEAAKDLGIKVSNTPDGPTEAVAEMCLTALLTLLREVSFMNNALHQSKWEKKIGLSVKGLNVLLIGYGRIGRKFAEHLKYLGANLLICDPFVKPDQLSENETSVSLEEGLTKADVISLHASGQDEILGSGEFEKVKPGVVVLNSARGGLINEQSMIDALENGKIGSAWIDAFWTEPYEGKLADYEQVLLTPHAATYTKQCRESMEMAAVQNLLKDLGLK